MKRRRIGRGMIVAVALASAVLAPGATRAAVTCAPTTTPQGAPWPGGEWGSYGGDFSNTRHQAAETTIGPDQAASLAPVWTFLPADNGADGDVTGTPVVVDGCVYGGTSTGWVFALNADTGETVWKTKLADESSFWQGGIFGSVGVGAGKVFGGVANTGSPFVVALDQDTGAPAWPKATTVDTQGGSEIYSSPSSTTTIRATPSRRW